MYFIGSSFSPFHGIFTDYAECDQHIQQFLKTLSKQETKCIIYVVGGIEPNEWIKSAEREMHLKDECLTTWYEWTSAKQLTRIGPKRGYGELNRRKETKKQRKKDIQCIDLKSLLSRS